MKIFTGQVISTKMKKTATVAVERVFAHPVYKKRIKKIKKYHVHDDMGVKKGQIVKFVASRPYSRLKKWKIIEVVSADNVGKSQIEKKKSKKITKKLSRSKNK